METNVWGLVGAQAPEQDLKEEQQLLLHQMGLGIIGRSASLNEACRAFPQLLGLAQPAGAFSFGPLPIEHLRNAGATLVLHPVVPRVVDALPILGPHEDHEVTARLHPGVRPLDPIVNKFPNSCGH